MAKVCLFVFVNLYSSSAPSFQDHGQLSYSVCLMSFILSLSLAFEQHVINCAVAVCEHQGEPSVCNEAFFVFLNFQVSATVLNKKILSINCTTTVHWFSLSSYKSEKHKRYKRKIEKMNQVLEHFYLILF